MRFQVTLHTTLFERESLWVASHWLPPCLLNYTAWSVLCWLICTFQNEYLTWSHYISWMWQENIWFFAECNKLPSVIGVCDHVLFLIKWAKSENLSVSLPLLTDVKFVWYAWFKTGEWEKEERGDCICEEGTNVKIFSNDILSYCIWGF